MERKRENLRMVRIDGKKCLAWEEGRIHWVQSASGMSVGLVDGRSPIEIEKARLEADIKTLRDQISSQQLKIAKMYREVGLDTDALPRPVG